MIIYLQIRAIAHNWVPHMFHVCPNLDYRQTFYHFFHNALACVFHNQSALTKDSIRINTVVDTNEIMDIDINCIAF